jgi:hypothetical protein
MLAPLLALGAALGAPQAEASTALNGQRSTPLDTVQPPTPGSYSPMELCKRTWSKAVEAMPESAEGDVRPELRGDAFRTTTPPSLLFVHVGKTCGATVGFALRDNQRLLNTRHPLQPAYDEVHTHPVRWGVLAAADHVLVSLRDPIDRVVSSYNSYVCVRETVLDENGQRAAVNSQSECKRKPTEVGFTREAHARLIFCFPSVNEFAERLDEDNECGRLARDSLQYDFGFGHAAMGACFYMGGMMDLLQNKSVFVVETKTCDSDINAIAPWLGLRNDSFKLRQELHAGGFPHHDDTLSVKGRDVLRQHLAHEYAFVDELRRMAVKH